MKKKVGSPKSAKPIADTVILRFLAIGMVLFLAFLTGRIFYYFWRPEIGLEIIVYLLFILVIQLAIPIVYLSQPPTSLAFALQAIISVSQLIFLVLVLRWLLRKKLKYGHYTKSKIFLAILAIIAFYLVTEWLLLAFYNDNIFYIGS